MRLLMKLIISTNFVLSAGYSWAQTPLGCDLELAGYISVNFIGAKIATFKAGEYRSRMEPQLLSMGVDLIYIEDPDDQDLRRFTQEYGFYHAPMYVIWTRPLMRFEDYLQTLNSEQRHRFKSRLKKSKGRIRSEMGPLTVKDFAEWYAIYDREIVSKDRGRRVIEPTWAVEKGAELGRYQRLFFVTTKAANFLGALF